MTIVDKDAPATCISMGFPIPVLRGQQDWYPLAVATLWFGEHRHSASHLYQFIRELRGLNYGDYAYIEHFANGDELQFPQPNDARRQQIFEIWCCWSVRMRCDCLPCGRPCASSSIWSITGCRRKNSRRRIALGKYVLHYAPTTMDRLGYALDDRFYGIDGSHLDNYRRRMQAMTRAEVNAAIKKYWQTENLQIVIVTKDAQALREALAADQPSPITYPASRPADVLREDEQISRFPLRIPRENIKIVPVKELFEKAG